MSSRLSPEEAAAQRKERLEALHEQLTDGVAKLAGSDEWLSMLKTARMFHRYSFWNQVLIAMQDPEATRVAGYRTWKKLGRQVRAGEKAIYVLAPMKGKREIEDEQTGEKQVVQSLRGFRPVAVFDIRQSDGPELPGLDSPVIEGDAPAALWDGLVGLLDHHGYRVEVGTPHVLGADGSTDPETKLVRIKPGSPAHEAAVLLHEFGHIRLGHVEDIASYVTHRGRMELEAESFAYVVGASYGVEFDEAAIRYLAGWARGDAKQVGALAATVVTAASSALDELGLGAERDALGVEVGI